MRMSIISYFKNTGRYYLRLLGFFAVLFLAWFVYARCGYTSIGFVWMATVYCGLNLLLLFPWGYKETDAFAMGWYTGMVFIYILVAAGLEIYLSGQVSWLGLSAGAMIAVFILVFLLVPIVKFLQEHHEKNT